MDGLINAVRWGWRHMMSGCTTGAEDAKQFRDTEIKRLEQDQQQLRMVEYRLRRGHQETSGGYVK